MFFHILKKDIKRRKTMNTILLLFVILASMFLASSINNIVTVMTGTEYFFEKAGVGDLLLQCKFSDTNDLKKIIDNEPSITSYKLEEGVLLEKDSLSFNNTNYELSNSGFLIPIQKNSLKTFDENNNEIKHINRGEIRMTQSFISKSNLKVGDTVTIEIFNAKKDFRLAGALKDACLGSSMIETLRILVNPDDYNDFLNMDKDILNTQKIQLTYLKSNDIEKTQKTTSEISELLMSADRSLLKTTYVIDMIIAGIILVLSMCLILVSFVVLKFSIKFSISEEYREIGVMKAIGIKNIKIRTLYISKYVAIAILGSLIGFIASFPFGNLLIQSVSKNMVLGNSIGSLLNILSSILVVLFIIGFAFFSTRMIKKSSPINAIHQGETGERFRKKRGVRLSKSPFKPSSYLAINDILSRPKHFLSIVIAFTICTLLTMIVANTSATLNSDKFIHLFGTVTADAYITNYIDDSKLKNESTIEKEIKAIKKKLNDVGIQCKLSSEYTYNLKINANGKEMKYFFSKGYNTKTTDYKYTEGTAPQSTDEIAITHVVSDDLGAKIGDTIQVNFGNETRELTVSGYFDTMDNLGQMIRLHEDTDVPFEFFSLTPSLQIHFLDNPSDEEITNRVEKIKKIVETDSVYDKVGYTVDCMKVADSISSIEYLLFSIMLIVVILICILMEKSFITDEKKEIATLKAIGISNATIIKWHISRLGILSLIAEIIAIPLSILLTGLTMNPIFKNMGAGDIEFVINPLKSFLIFPLSILVVTIIITFLTALSTNKINANDTASIE